jgi:hypothetical protein
MKTIKELSTIVGGQVYENQSTFFILSQGDQLNLPKFTITYPLASGLSTQYTLNGSTVHCNKNKEDNTWSAPSAVSNSFCSRDSVSVYSDGTYLYVEAVYAIPSTFGS